MRYTHSFKAVRSRKHLVKISVIFSVLIGLLVILLGFSFLDANQFFVGFLQSLLRVCVSYILALAISLTLVLLVTSSSYVEEMMIPVLDVLQSFPSFALYPLFVIWFGKNSIVTVLILIFEMIWPILFSVISAKKVLRSDLKDAARVFGATGFKGLRYVIFPLLFPAIITGSVVAWGEAWEAIIAAEIVVNIPGVGTYLAKLGEGNQQPILMTGILLLLLLLYLLNKYIWLPLLNLSTRYQTD